MAWGSFCFHIDQYVKELPLPPDAEPAPHAVAVRPAVAARAVTRTVRRESGRMDPPAGEGCLTGDMALLGSECWVSEGGVAK
ncbi:hypothetical protein SHO565_64470 [Streptomyces sp. HO565]